MIKNINKIVFVGISGGVDSAVSAAILKDQGYTVVGVFIKTWTPDFTPCTWRDERRDAMRVCAHLQIPFLECDAEEVYKKKVADYMIEEYKKGNTPNPDVMCNREVKFGVFWDFAKERGADFIATGHYAINELLHSNSSSQRQSELHKSKDVLKDQVYFLWTLTQDDLSHTLFPIGHLEKSEVRKLASKYKIPVATKKDSQGVCFLGQIDMKDFLKHYIETKNGDVLDFKGNIIGEHDGAVFFTLGERHGFTLNKKSDNSRPLYVTSKDIVKNTITVSEKQNQKNNLNLITVINCNKFNWISKVPENDKIYTAQIRYHGELLNCLISEITFRNSKGMIKITFEKEVLVDSGQSIVVYDGDVCLGGGIVL